MRFKKPLEGALFFALKGYKVFPLKPNTKIPAITNWQEWATKATEQKIKDYGTANVRHNWAVYCGGSNLTVIDIDVKNGQPGMDNFKKLVADSKEQFTYTLRVKTPSGGVHFYYYTSTKTCKLAEGIDVRGKGAYVVCPGSIIDEVDYTIDDSTVQKIENLPTWLHTKIYDKAYKEPEAVKEEIVEGNRNNQFISIAGSMRRRGLNYNEILAALNELNNRTHPPLSEQELHNIAKTASNYKPEEVKAALAFEAIDRNQAIKSVADIKLESIPKRDWILENRYIGGFVSATIAPGGIGKSTLVINDAFSISTGESYSKHKVIKQGGVWIYNTEDPEDETERRLGAFCLHNNIPFEKANGIYYSSSKNHPFVVAKSTKEGVVVNKAAIEFAVEFIRDNHIVLMIVDPFVRCHECNENDNMEIDKVVQCFQQIVDRTGCAISLVHHTSKAGALHNSQTSDPDMYAARGASALINAVRIANVLTTMSEAEAHSFNIGESKRKYYVRLDNAKANLQPPAERAEWFEKVSVMLPNTDSVGVLQHIDLQNTTIQKIDGIEIDEKKELGKFLYSLLQPGNPAKCQIPVAELVEGMEYDDNISFILTHKAKADNRKKIIGLLNTGLIYKGVDFMYSFNPNTTKKHFVIAKYAEKEGLDYGSPTLPSVEFLE